MIKQRDVVQVMNLKYKGEPLECTKCSHSMLVVDIVYDFIEGKLEYLTLVDGDNVYPNLNYAAFCGVVYNVIIDLVDYTCICNNVLRGIDESVVLQLGENITISEQQEKTVKYEKGKIVISAKSLRLCRDREFNRISKHIVYMLGSIYTGVGYMCYDKHFKGKRFGFDKDDKCATPKDIFAKEFANLMMLRTNFANCNQVVSPRCRNSILVVKALKEKGFNIA